MMVGLAVPKQEYITLKPIPSKRSYPVPPTSPYGGATRRVTHTVRPLENVAAVNVPNGRSEILGAGIKNGL
jgi:hypothetical protein